MAKPIFTIGIPSYNQQEYLADAIDSALAQPNSEVIVCDDGSTDDSFNIAARYNIDYPRVKIIRQVNKGLASARNTIIMNMKGDFLLPLDADDILLDNCVEKLITAIAENPKADVISPSFKTFGTSSETIILMPNPTIEDFWAGNRVGYCSAIKKKALLEIGGYSPRMDKGWEDYHLWFNMLKRGKKIVTVPEVLWLYRTKEESMWTESVKHGDELWKQINKDFLYDTNS